MAAECIFNSPPAECIWKPKGPCTAGSALIVQCVINHQRLMLTQAGQARAMQSFSEGILDRPRPKPMSGQAGRDAIKEGPEG